MSSTWIISQSAFIFLCMSCLMISLILSEPMKIRPKQCSNAIGEEGTCMFVWECIKTEGKHLGTCVDGFLFGSCCGHNESFNSLDQGGGPSESSIPVIEISTTTNNKDRHKNKWKPPTTTVAPTTTITPVRRTTVRTTTSTSTVPPPPLKNATNSVWSQFPGISKPMTSQRPWYIYPGNKPVMGSTVRPAIITVLATNKPSAHLPLLSNIPNKNYTHRPTFRPTFRPTPSSTLANEWTTSALLGETSSKIPSITVITGSLDADRGSASESATSPELTTTLAGQVSESTKRPPSGAKSQCGVTQLRPKTKVVGGKNSAFGAWPWQVSVRRTHFFGFSSTHRCGGAILNNQWIATAGHCVDDLLLTQIRIRVGEYDFSSSLEPLPHVERGAKKKIVHPKYNFFTYENDLALVQLDEPIEFLPHISSICLPPDGVNLLGKNATVTGWGRLSEGGVLPTVLQEVRVPIVSNDKCKNMFLSAGRHEYIPDIFMCAGYDEGGRDSCQGDSGGPLTVQNEDGRWFLAGIISWGIGCGEPSLPGVCTRISKFKQWILSYIAN